MAIKGPEHEEVLGGEEQTEQPEQPEQTEIFDDKVIRVIRNAVGIPDDLRVTLEKEYNDPSEVGGIRDTLHEGFGDALKISRVLGDIDPESSAVYALIKQKVQERGKSQLFQSYLDLMYELGYKPVDPETFAALKLSGYLARNQQKRGLDQSIQLRFQEIEDQGMGIGKLVALRSDSNRYKRVSTIVNITRDCYLILAGSDHPIDPRLYRIQT